MSRVEYVDSWLRPCHNHFKNKISSFKQNHNSSLIEPLPTVEAARCRGRGEVRVRPLQELRAAEEARRDGRAAEAAAAGAAGGEGVICVGEALGAREAELVGALKQIHS